ncbi:hypothetical protein SAMD00019534_111160 [Acytostelium subglobosum LB1]|uniref:hypothetical protein n=1 Tax=Acytostelium subglobosum LB1 TaxID=1410327 RepID=UPI000644A816|nr:hypothetical protein SAMD00019534_111160 [Acytostelium subglobosum LB1]GAM27940.1 hypothetical protein SAMD00019534_111160 [Acytostelium subglobosum LB1]|eukprot:XP_012749223.1 hypothetical protein SAMD00019534_111160 [Acytostelium subglobosum LB1]
MFSYCEGYRVEGVTDATDPQWKQSSSSSGGRKQVGNEAKVVINPSIFRQVFYGDKYKTFVSYYSPLGPVAITIKLDDEIYKCLVYTEKGVELIEVPKWSVYRSFWRWVSNKDPSFYHIMCQIKPELRDFKLPMLRIPNLEDELMKIYEPSFSKVMKVGVLYCKEGQTTESEMLFNNSNNTSVAYNEFLNLLGDKVELKGFQGYNGGLDTVHGHSGSHSIYTRYGDVEIMFHVSTMLPFYPKDPKQIERKKHLGNDRIVIVFSDAGAYAPNSIKSKQTQSVFLVQPHRDSTSKFIENTIRRNAVDQNELEKCQEKYKDEFNAKQYSMSIATKEDVPQFDPPIPDPPIFNRDNRFREFILEKLINGSASLRQAPVFQTKTQREKNFVFLNFVNKYSK